MTDVEWLRSQEFFGGYDFWRLDDNEIDRAAKIIRRVVEREEFVRVLVAEIEVNQSALQYRVSRDLKEDSDEFDLNRFRDRAQLATWNGYRSFAILVEDIVTRTFWALREFESYPKRSPREHTKQLETVAALASELATRLENERALVREVQEVPGGTNLNEVLSLLTETAREHARNPPLARPTAKHAARTFVAKKVTGIFYDRFRGFRHAAAATLINEVFPDDEPIDAAYMQSISRGETYPSE